MAGTLTIDPMFYNKFDYLLARIKARCFERPLWRLRQRLIQQLLENDFDVEEDAYWMTTIKARKNDESYCLNFHLKEALATAPWEDAPIFCEELKEVFEKESVKFHFVQFSKI